MCEVTAPVDNPGAFSRSWAYDFYLALSKEMHFLAVYWTTVKKLNNFSLEIL